MTNKDKNIAFISGAAGGLGQKAAELFYAQGYRLWLTDCNQKTLEAMAEKYPGTRIDITDLTDHEALETLCCKIEECEDTIALAFVNAGISFPGKVTEISRKQLDLQLSINMRSACHLDHALAKVMVKRGKGHLINTLSTAAMVSLPEGAPYSASKFGLRGFLLALAAELRPQGISVSGIYPNAIDTPMLHFEAVNGGSALNFLDDPITADDVILGIEKALKGKKTEYFVPAKDSLTARLVCAFPGVLNRLYPLLEKAGEKGREKYIRKKNLSRTG